MSTKAGRRILEGLAIYAALWALTATVGRHQVREPIVAAIRDTVIKARPTLRAVELRNDDFRGHSGETLYYVTAFSPGPFFIRIRRGYQIEPLWGAGADEWFLWVFGAKIRLAQARRWYS